MFAPYNITENIVLRITSVSNILFYHLFWALNSFLLFKWRLELFVYLLLRVELNHILGVV